MRSLSPPKLRLSTQLLSAGFYGLFFFLYWIERSPAFAAGLAGLFLAFSFFNKPLRAGMELTLAVTATHLLLWSLRFAPPLNWPFDFFIVAAAGFLFIRLVFRKTLRLKWSFKFSRKELLSVACINIPSIAVLLWYFERHPEVARQWPLPPLPAWAVPFVVILVAALNGLREEIYYRGLLQTLSMEKFSPWFVIFFQGLSFGALHFSGGFPQGWVGVALTAAWGALIAWQYLSFRSIALAWVTHSIADAVMFTVILTV